tara:strand:- start:12506 stop:18235 length:5730 start_codon:yes stop_codon:yes gene_type:complete
MAIKQRQKDIVNPYAQDAERYNSSERRGVGYSYSDSRNKFVIDAIHDSFKNFGIFPDVGIIVGAIGPLQNLSDAQRRITVVDAQAYCALYPQNAKVVADKFKLLSDNEIFSELEKLANILLSEGVAKSYETATTSEAQFIENQTIMPSNSGEGNIPYRSAQDEHNAAKKQTVARLIAIPSAQSSKYTNSLRESLGMPDAAYEIDDTLYLFNNAGLIPYTSQNTNVDLYDWRNNVDPGTENSKVYYNPIDSNYYYVVRTTNTQPLDYVNTIGMMDIRLNEGTISNLKGLLRSGISEILKFTQKYSEPNLSSFISSPITGEEVIAASLRGNRSNLDEGASLSTYMDERPSSPWIGCVRIPRLLIDKIPGGYSVSYEEFELTPLEKARVIADKARSSMVTYRLPIQVGSLTGKLAATRKVLKSYMRDLIEEGVSKSLLKNVNLEKEIDNLHNFISYLQLLYNYNKLSLNDDDIIEFYFSDSFALMHMCINGNLITRGIGNLDFVNTENDSEPTILDAFGLMSPTSFSFLFYSPYIFKEYLEKANSSGRSWVDFLSTYMYPPLDMTAISTQIEANKKKDASSLNQKRKQNVFQKVSEISKVPAQSFEEMYLKRPLRYKLENIESNIQCSTAQARYTKYALGIAKAFTTQTKIKSVTRQVILILKNEVISDAVKRAKISIDGQEVGLQDAENLGFRYSDNPELIRRDIERFVNEEIFCSLDAIGDFIEESFLDPLGAPPVASELVRATLDQPIKFEFKEKPAFSIVDTKRKSYEKIVNGIVENFLNALLAGIIRDLVNAFLGCGPNTTREDEGQLRNSYSQTVYGGVQIREFLSDVDIVEKAAEANIVQDTPITQDNPTGVRPVTFTQMSTFLDDVSKIVTASEATALLRGDAPAYLYDVILEMSSRTDPIPIRLGTEIETNSYSTVNFDSDNLNVYFELLGNGNPTTEAYSSLSPIEAYCLNQEAGNSDLGIDFLPEEQLIIQLDESMKSKMLKISFFCDFLRNALDFQAQLDELMDLIPSMGWYDDLLSDIAEFSNSLADSFAEMLSGLSSPEDPYPTSPQSNFYTTQFGTQTFWGTRYQFLYQNTTADVHPQSDDLDQDTDFDGLWIETSIKPRDTFSFKANKARFNLGLPEYNWGQKFNLTRIGRWDKLFLPAYKDFTKIDTVIDVNNYRTSRFSQTFGTPVQIYLSRQRDGVSNFSTYWDSQDLRLPLPKVALVLRGSNVTPTQLENRKIPNAGTGFSIVDISDNTEPETFRENLEKIMRPGVKTSNLRGPLLASDPLVGGRESSGDLFGTFESQLPGLNYSMLTQLFMDNLSYRRVGDFKISSGNSATINTRNQFAMNVDAWGAGNDLGGPDRTPDTKQNPNLLMFGNPRLLNERNVETFYTSTLAQRRLPPFVRAVNKFPFDLVSDECVTPREEEIASSIISSIQARIARLMFNAGPLLSPYPRWGSDGTLYLLSDYLLRKLEIDYSSNKLMGAIYDNFDIVEKAYSDPEENLNRDFRFFKDRIPRENFRVLIRCILYKMFDNIAENTEYTQINKSIFEGEGENKFRLLIRSYFNRMMAYYTTEDPQPEEAAKFEALLLLGFGPDADEAQYFQAGAYFFPLAQLYAAYIITWDIANVSHAVKTLDLQLNTQAAQADDSILTAINGSLTTQFGQLYTGFPVTIVDYENLPRTYYTRDETNSRVEFLKRSIAALRDPAAPDFGMEEKEDWWFEAQREGYCEMDPAGAPDEYFTFMKNLMTWAGQHPNHGGLGASYILDVTEEQAVRYLSDKIAVAANNRFRRSLSDAYDQRTIQMSLCDICDLGGGLEEFISAQVGYTSTSIAEHFWDEDSDSLGRGTRGHESIAASTRTMEDHQARIMQKVCTFINAETLADAALAWRSEEVVDTEIDRIFINIARIQGEINILSRYI